MQEWMNGSLHRRWDFFAAILVIFGACVPLNTSITSNQSSEARPFDDELAQILLSEAVAADSLKA